ncbi:hypothetical protein KAR91_20760 [Candidatus Pacearchaeota archaeon]|nr:hypothetical protein [Candidatus Pacearchaeota archaeon]
MSDYRKVIPSAVRNEPTYVQEAYIREFRRVEEQTGNASTALTAADNLLTQLKYKLRQQRNSSKKREVELMGESMEVKILAHVSEMSASECLSPEMLAQIKRTDPHPFLVVYDVGGEGVSNGRVDNKKERKTWSFHAIKKLSRKIREGVVGVIHGHNAVGENTKRKVGRIVHAFTKNIRNSLHALAVAHITDENIINKIKNGKFDVCSIEGDVLLARENVNSTWFVKDVDRIFNLAIGSSAIDSPGFTGAGVMATIQEMNKE